MANPQLMQMKKDSKLRKHFPLLTYLQSLSPRAQKSLIKGATREILEAFSEICLNLIKKNVPLTAGQKEKLRPFEEEIYQLALKKHSVVKKKQIIQKGGFLGALLGSVVPALISTLIAATSK